MAEVVIAVQVLGSGTFTKDAWKKRLPICMLKCHFGLVWDLAQDVEVAE